jgi:hypothetical protein
MAKISVEVDTETKQFDVVVDGVKVENVNRISISPPMKESDYYYLDISQYEKMDNGMHKSTYMSASGSEKFQESNSGEMLKGLAKVLVQRDFE